MTLQVLPGYLPWPNMNASVLTPQILSGTTLDADGEYVCVIIAAREAMTISHVGARIQTATGSPTMDVRIETVDTTTGLPTGTLWATNTNLVTGSLSTGWTLHALTASASIAKGQVFAVKLLYNSGTTIVLNTVQGSSYVSSAMPYAVINTGTPTKTVITAAHAIGLGSSTTAFYFVRGLAPVSSIGGGTFNNTSSAKRGLKFIPPFACRAVGLRLFTGTAVGDFRIQMEDNGGSILNSSDTLYEGDALLNLSTGCCDLFFDNAVPLAAGTTYRAAIEPSSSTNTSLLTLTLPSANYRSAFPNGLNQLYCTYTASAWVDTATDQLPMIDILIDELDDGINTAGGGNPIIGG